MYPSLHGADVKANININSTQSADVNVNVEVSSAASADENIDANIKFMWIIHLCVQILSLSLLAMTSTLPIKSPACTVGSSKLIYHDFLPTSRRGSHVKSDCAHTII